MRLPLRFLVEVEQDILSARDWYEARAEGLGAEFLQELDSVVDRIRTSPRLYAAEHRSIRRAPLRRFPFVVYSESAQRLSR